MHPLHPLSALMTALLALGAPVALAPSEGGGSHAEIVTPSGLRFTDVRIGQGQEATEGKIVEVHYTGWLEGGKKFESTDTCHKPMAFRLGAGDVIKGLDLGVAGMREGGKRRLIIPPDLGFGRQGGGGVIPPNAVLTYEVELLAVR
jgi:FKBP-type peptidyl-prolyl cis-trans isomerase FkpA